MVTGDRPPLAINVPGRLNNPAQKLTSNLRHFKLLEPAQYTWRHEDQIYRITVPKNFVHDFASVPRFLWALISPLDLGLASIFHDRIYRNGGQITTEFYHRGQWNDAFGPSNAWTREQADRLFARIMREQGVVKWRRRAAYAAVRAFGVEHWNNEGE